MFIKHRRSAAGWIAGGLLVVPVIAGVVGADRVQAAEPTWAVSWSLNPSNDIEELSRTFDIDEDGVIDASADPATALPQVLNPDQFSLHVRACTAPPGFTSIDWTLARPDEAPLPPVTTAECETDLVLPDKPFPEAREYTLTATVHYPSTPDQVRESTVRVQDVFMVGFGDSYGSGEGNPLTIDEWFGSQEATWDNKRCHRSRLSGQEIAARELDQMAGVNVTFLHLACSGALASRGILEPYMGIEPSDDDLPPLPPQIDQAIEYVNHTTNAAGEKRYPDVIVTSIGGNDAGFATVVEECVTYPDWILVPIPVFPFAVPIDFDPCFAPGQAGTEVFQKQGLPKLEGLYASINASVDSAVCNPNLPCDFLITEYPDGATDEDGETCSVNPGFSEEEFQWVIDSMVPQLNDAISTAAEANGWKHVSGVRDNFYKHGICAEDDYMRDLAESKDIQGGIDGAFHPDTSGHMFGYAPAIGSALRTVLDFPYSGPTYTGPMYAGTGAPQVCDSKIRDGNREHAVAAPATDPTGLGLPEDIASDLVTGQLPIGQAVSNSCSVYADTGYGFEPSELRTGSSGCPSDPRPCVGSNGASSLLRLPSWGDQAPVIEAQAAADVDGKAGDNLPTDKHRYSYGGAQGTTVFYALAAEGSDTVTGEIVVDLTAYTQSGGARAHAGTEFDLDVISVINQESCNEDEYCSPSTRTQIAGVELSLERRTCQADGQSSHSCGSGAQSQGSRSDDIEMSAWAGGQTIVDIDDNESYPYATGAAMGSAVAVRSGLATPRRQVRLPYSVAAGSVVLIKVSASTSNTIGEECTFDWTNFPCSGQGRITSKIGFAPDGTTGALAPLPGFVAPVSGDTTPPSITATLAGTLGSNGWYRSPVDVALAATDEDGGSGVASISHAVDSGNPQVVNAATATASVVGDGTHTVTYSAADGSGNTSPTGTSTFKIDATAPVISITPVDGSSYPKGANVSTGLACADPHSGVATCTGPATLDTITSGSRTVTFNATDLAGNSIQRTLAYTVLAPPPPPPPPPVKDLVNIRIPELGYTVDGAVTTGGFEITRAANGQVNSVSGTATFTRPSGNRLTVTLLAVRIAGVWVGAINVNDPSARVNVSAGTLSRSGVTAVGSNGATGQFTTGGRPNRTINWTVTDID